MQHVFPRYKKESLESKRDNLQFNFVTFNADTIEPKKRYTVGQR